MKAFGCRVAVLLAAERRNAMGMDQDHRGLMPINAVQHRLAGNLLALVGSISLASRTQVTYLFNPGISLLALLFSAAIDVTCGYGPARWAAHLDPIVALQHEHCLHRIVADAPAEPRIAGASGHRSDLQNLLRICARSEFPHLPEQVPRWIFKLSVRPDKIRWTLHKSNA